MQYKIKPILRTFLGIFFLLNGLSLSASHTYPADTTQIAAWMGEWEGILEIFNAKGKVQEVRMKVRHFKTDTVGTYGWFLIYGDETTGTRPYYLKTIDAEKGHYRVDEKNSILLDSHLINNKMISIFEVNGTLIQSIYTLEDEKTMIFEIFFGRTDDVMESGNTLFQGNEIPLVKSYPAGGYQKAVLTRLD